MQRVHNRRIEDRLCPVVALALALTLVLGLAGAAAAETAVGDGHAAWLLARAGGSEIGGGSWALDQGEFADPDLSFNDDSQGAGTSGGLQLLASAVLPGAGEALMGYTRGYFMMALDIFSWTQVAKKHQDGKDLADEYYAFADAHWSVDDLVSAYNPTATDDYRRGLGLTYFPNDDGNTASSVDDLDGVLSLWVTEEEDRREYYENLGKWDQFVFGWDDFRRPDDPPAGIAYDPTLTISDLRQPWTSYNRVEYRKMRDASNDAYKSRDRYLYLNIGLRVFSVLQVAYLQGLLGGGGPGNGLQVAGHDVQIIAQPLGSSSGQVAASVSF